MIVFLIIVFATFAYAAFFIESADEHNENNFDLSQNKTEYNPATGLPMIGALDSMGNSMGSSAFDHNSWNSDYYHSTYNSSSYDPFSNRY